MARRDHLHLLVDDLPESEVPTAERVLEALSARERAIALALDAAPVDDEAESPGERIVAEEAWQEHRQGKSLTSDEVRRELGLE